MDQKKQEKKTRKRNVNIIVLSVAVFLIALGFIAPYINLGDTHIISDGPPLFNLSFDTFDSLDAGPMPNFDSNISRLETYYCEEVYGNYSVYKIVAKNCLFDEDHDLAKLRLYRVMVAEDVIQTVVQDITRGGRN